MPIPLDFGTLSEALEDDPYTKQIIADLTYDPALHPDFSLAANHLYFKDRLVIPDYPEFKAKILSEAHETPNWRTWRLSKNSKTSVCKFFLALFETRCKIISLICQKHKYETLAPAGLLQPLPVPNRVWEDISLDFIVGLPSSNSFVTILVVVNRFSKHSHFIALSHPFTAKTVAALFCREIVRLHGIPRSILSDRNVVFLSAFWQELFRLKRTRLRMGTLYYPQSDGQTEVVIDVLKPIYVVLLKETLNWISLLGLG